MRVLFDHDIFSLQRFGGISRYFHELIQRLPPHGIEPELFYGLTGNLYLLGRSVGRGVYLPMPKPMNYAVNAALQAPKMASTRARLLHKTYYTGIAPRHARVVITVHDMIPERFAPHQAEMSKRKREWCKRADHIITVSEATRRDLLEMFDVDERKVTTVHHGVAVCERRAAGIELPESFLLYVGTRSIYKNFERLVEAYAGSKVRAESELVCFGGGSFSERERGLFEKLQVADRVRYLGGGDDVLTACYQSARAFVYPSLCEGFGLPLLEAMAHGCPVICSRIAPFVEVAGDAAAYFDPLSMDAMREGLEAALGNASVMERIRVRGAARVREFSFDRCAKETAGVYARLV